MSEWTRIKQVDEEAKALEVIAHMKMERAYSEGNYKLTWEDAVLEAVKFRDELEMGKGKE